MDKWLGEARARVILPITDPYVVHHGALGSFATAYLPDDADVADIVARLLAPSRASPNVLTRQEAVETYELPADRIGDIVIVSGENFTVGTSEDRHDLAALNEPLRSHGGLTEQDGSPLSSIASSTCPESPSCAISMPCTTPPKRRPSDRKRARYDRKD